ncbi:MAG: 2-amino-4-hydroxy-6-hydroxymethyldihydropteridine diphosphokinase [Dysgonomonas sp.]|nr:2-amino-4-hydroxy-6-hydroxymethyldihydropteridine diphosphokinase [Dysgonomonas sp.]
MDCIFVPIMNKVLISIGTNENTEANLLLCHHLLENTFSDIKYSQTSITAPYGVQYKNNFLNQLALLYTKEDIDYTTSLLKSFEKKIGRTPSDKEKGIVKIDIDIVVWNDKVIKPNDISRSYIVDLLPTLRDNIL